MRALIEVEEVQLACRNHGRGVACSSEATTFNDVVKVWFDNGRAARAHGAGPPVLSDGMEAVVVQQVP